MLLDLTNLAPSSYTLVLFLRYTNIPHLICNTFINCLKGLFGFHSGILRVQSWVSSSSSLPSGLPFYPKWYLSTDLAADSSLVILTITDIFRGGPR